MHESKVRHVSEQLLTLIRSGTIEELKGMLKVGNRGPNDVDDKGHTLFFYAMHHNRLDLADLLLEAGANVDCRSPHEWTPLFWATHNQHEQAVRYLLSLMAQIRTCALWTTNGRYSGASIGTTGKLSRCCFWGAPTSHGLTGMVTMCFGWRRCLAGTECFPNWRGFTGWDDAFWCWARSESHGNT